MMHPTMITCFVGDGSSLFHAVFTQNAFYGMRYKILYSIHMLSIHILSMESKLIKTAHALKSAICIQNENLSLEDGRTRTPVQLLLAFYSFSGYLSIFTVLFLYLQLVGFY